MVLIPLMLNEVPTIRDAVKIPETLSCRVVRLVVDVTPNVVMPETLSCCEVRLVVDVTPNVVIPEELIFLTTAKSFSVN